LRLRPELRHLEQELRDVSRRRRLDAHDMKRNRDKS
jgi:hypothetical protein